MQECKNEIREDERKRTCGCECLTAMETKSAFFLYIRVRNILEQTKTENESK